MYGESTKPGPNAATMRSLTSRWLISEFSTCWPREPDRLTTTARDGSDCTKSAHSSLANSRSTEAHRCKFCFVSASSSHMDDAYSNEMRYSQPRKLGAYHSPS